MTTNLTFVIIVGGFQKVLTCVWQEQVKSFCAGASITFPIPIDYIPFSVSCSIFVISIE